MVHGGYLNYLTEKPKVVLVFVNLILTAPLKKKNSSTSHNWDYLNYFGGVLDFYSCRIYMALSDVDPKWGGSQSLAPWQNWPSEMGI